MQRNFGGQGMSHAKSEITRCNVVPRPEDVPCRLAPHFTVFQLLLGHNFGSQHPWQTLVRPHPRKCTYPCVSALDVGFADKKSHDHYYVVIYYVGAFSRSLLLHLLCIFQEISCVPPPRILALCQGPGNVVPSGSRITSLAGWQLMIFRRVPFPTFSMKNTELDTLASEIGKKPTKSKLRARFKYLR